jgi:hypothetical protein
MGKDTGGLVHKIGDFVNRPEAADTGFLAVWHVSGLVAISPPASPLSPPISPYSRPPPLFRFPL